MIFDQEPLTRLVGLAAGIHIRTQRIAERALKAVGLTWAQFGVLAAIAERDGRSQRGLAERLETDANTLMVICNSLQKKRLAKRLPDPADRRVWRISLTKEGWKVFHSASSIIEGLSRPLEQVLTKGQIARALSPLERLYRHLTEQERPKGGRET